MKLSELLKNMTEVPSSLECEVTNLVLDSRLVKPGDLFLACVGTELDGRQFISDAIKKGACAVLAEADHLEMTKQDSIPIIPIKNLSTRIGAIAARFFGNPTQKMHVIGVTGTNGKTSCTHFIGQALQHLNISCGVIGTLGSGLYGHIEAGSLTTPDAITLQKTLHNFLKQGTKYAAMEVSSHSLEQGRVNEIAFEIGVFTNLTRDHLDYHGTMENYGKTKKKLFEKELRYAVVSADDEFGKTIIADFPNQKNIFSYSAEKKSSVHVENIELTLEGMHATIYSPWGQGKLHSSLIGKFNVSNLLAVFTTLCLLEIPFEIVLELISRLQPVPGRMQTFGGKQKPLVVVDYSHTPDALEKALNALRHHTQGKLFCIFGCGGNRDRGKRPIMAKIAEDNADYVIVSDDNPRHEDPAQIAADIMKGFLHPEKVIVQHDRAKAIHETIRQAKAGDCILVAGKGAETYQIIGDEKKHFVDEEQVKLGLLLWVG